MSRIEALVDAVAALALLPAIKNPGSRKDYSAARSEIVRCAVALGPDIANPRAYEYTSPEDVSGHVESLIVKASSRWPTLPKGWSERPLYG